MLSPSVDTTMKAQAMLITSLGFCFKQNPDCQVSKCKSSLVYSSHNASVFELRKPYICVTTKISLSFSKTILVSDCRVSILNSKKAIRFQFCVQHEALGKYVYIDCL
jgi:hypothetical protein